MTLKGAGLGATLTGIAAAATRVPLPQLRLLAITVLVALFLLLVCVLVIWFTGGDWIRIGPIGFQRSASQNGGRPSQTSGPKPSRQSRAQQRISRNKAKAHR